MSTPYPMLDNKPIDQWKVTELKEELRKRKMPIRGLKEELVKRLFDAIEMEKGPINDAETENGFDVDSNPQDTAEQGEPEPVAEDAEATVDENEKMVDETPLADVNHVAENEVVDYGVIVGEGDICQNASLDVSGESAGDAVSVENNETNIKNVIVQPDTCVEDPSSDVKLKDAEPLAEDAICNPLEPNIQVPEVSQDLGFNVKCESISTDSASINEKNKLKDNLNADNFHLEVDVKPEMVQPSSDSVPPVVGDVHTLVDEKGQDKDQVSMEEMDASNATSVELSKKEDSVDGGSPEKLDLDRSSGDDLMDEDVLESKPIESNTKSDWLQEGGEVEKVHGIDEGILVDVMAEDVSPDKKGVLDEEKARLSTPNEKQKLEVDEGSLVDVVSDGFSHDKKVIHAEDKVRPTTPSEKRKLEDHEVAKTNDTSKRQRRWNPETVKVPDLPPSNISATSTPRDSFKPVSKHIFARSDSTLSAGSPKERVVPPSPKTVTNSLRIDRFLRPFTLKAVQELLAKTGTVCKFWMDHIKTHCYVTYASAEEAIATRNAVYNLQWPPNGGRFLVAEFVDPEEVKSRLESPPQAPAPASASPATPTAPRLLQSQVPKLPQQNSLPQKLPPPPPLPLPPPPPLSELPRARERERQSLPLPLPPPPPLPQKKPEPSVVTLDDLFKKTKTTPRIYYLPLSEEQVAAKLATQGKGTTV